MIFLVADELLYRVLVLLARFSSYLHLPTPRFRVLDGFSSSILLAYTVVVGPLVVLSSVRSSRLPVVLVRNLDKKIYSRLPCVQ